MSTGRKDGQTLVKTQFPFLAGPLSSGKGGAADLDETALAVLARVAGVADKPKCCDFVN